MPRAIVAIGGGNIRTRGTARIDREIIRLSRKKRPRLLFIPTASSDSERYWKHVQEYFGKFLGCRTGVLFLIKERPTKEQIRAKILAADIIYVGGGNTLQMMRVWRRLGIDKLLKSAYENGTVLSGISAGAICWFTSGHSDSLSFSNPRNWKYINVRGLGFIPAVNCPHFNSRTRGIPRRKHFRDMIRKIGGLGIALENNCAIVFVDGRFYRVITSKNYARAYTLCKSGSLNKSRALNKSHALNRSGAAVVTKRIPQLNHLAPLASLFPRSLPLRVANPSR